MKKVVLIIALLLSFNGYAHGIEKISFWLQGFSVHSASKGMNERHENKGVCIDYICHMDFINSFGDPGHSWFFNFAIKENNYFIGGLRMGLIWGYETEPLPYIMPYIGVGYKFLWVETTYFPSPAGDGEYLQITLIRLEVFNKKW